MTIKQNGHTRNGWSQSGKGEVMSFWTVHDMAATGVIVALADLIDAGMVKALPLSNANTVTVNGVTYEANDDYVDAYFQQKNLDSLVNRLSLNSNPEYIRVHAPRATATDPNVDFGSAFAGVNGETFGDDLVAVSNSGNAPVVQVDVFFSQKAMFAGADKNAERGKPTLGAGDNYGDTSVVVETWIKNIDIYSTSNTNTKVDVDLTGGAVTVGDKVDVGLSASKRSIMVDVWAAPDLGREKINPPS